MNHTLHFNFEEKRYVVAITALRGDNSGRLVIHPRRFPKNKRQYIKGI